MRVPRPRRTATGEQRDRNRKDHAPPHEPALRDQAYRSGNGGSLHGGSDLGTPGARTTGAETADRRAGKAPGCVFQLPHDHLPQPTLVRRVDDCPMAMIKPNHSSWPPGSPSQGAAGSPYSPPMITPSTSATCEDPPGCPGEPTR